MAEHPEIAPEDAGIIRDILADILPAGCKAHVSGSRAGTGAGRAHRGSGLDIALESSAGPLPAVMLARLRDAFTGSRLPCTVDVLDVNAISADFRARIRPQFVPFPFHDPEAPALRFRDAQGRPFPDWQVKRLGEVGHFTGGGTPDTNIASYWAGDIPWISSSDLSEENIQNLKITRWITQDAIKASATQVTPKGAILIVTRVGIGKCAIAPKDLCTSQDFTNFVLGPVEIEDSQIR